VVYTYLLVHDSAAAGLALDNGVWNTHLSAKSWQEDHQLNWVDVVGDQHQRGLLVLDEGRHVIETVLDSVWLLARILLGLAFADCGSLLVQTLLLLRLSLRSVLAEELEGLCSGVAVESVLELGDRRRNLQAEVEDLLLALKTDILRPAHHTRKVALCCVLAEKMKRVGRRESRTFGWMSCPMPKLRGRFSRRGFCTVTLDENRCKEDHNLYIPLPASWRQPCPEGRALGQLSYPSLEAVIENRTSANLVHQYILSL